MGNKPKRKFGDRRDGVWLNKEGSMNEIMPYIYPNRADNEAFIQETVEMAPIKAYVEKKNNELKEKVERGELPASALEDPYKPFQIVLSALIKTMTLRPKLKRFVSGKKLFERTNPSIAFTVKKKFSDNAGEGLAYKEFGPETTLNDVHEKIVKEINFCKSETEVDNSTKFMDIFMKLPPFILRPLFALFRHFDQRGWMPYELIKTDPNYASCFITNLGSIGLKSGYHHLSNWGTVSIFVILGEYKWKPFFDKDGNIEMKETMGVGLTIDERIADGFYYSRSVKLFKKLLQNPELLEDRADTPVEF